MTLDINPPNLRIMTLSEFQKIPDNPRQRDTETHLKKAKKYLASPSPAQAVVHVASLPDGRLYKLDGHTRCLFWERNREIAPPRLSIMIYDVDTVEDAMELYTHFDNKNASEIARDQWTGAWKQIGFEPQNPRLRQGEGGYPLQLVHGAYCGFSTRAKETPYEIAPQWKHALMLADKIIDMRKGLIGIGIWVAMFATFKRHGPSALPFWQAYFNEAGTDDGKSFDGVKALLERRPKTGKTKTQDDMALAAYALGCFRRWRTGKRLLRRGPNGRTQRPDLIKPVEFLSGLKEQNEALARLPKRMSDGGRKGDRDAGDTRPSA